MTIEIEGVDTLNRKAVEVWGLRPQLLKTVEEAGELQKAIARYLISTQDGAIPKDADMWIMGELVTNLMEEVVDVEIMIGQLKIAFERHGGLYDLCRFEKVENLRRLLDLETTYINVEGEGPP